MPNHNAPKMAACSDEALVLLASLLELAAPLIEKPQAHDEQAISSLGKQLTERIHLLMIQIGVSGDDLKWAFQKINKIRASDDASPDDEYLQLKSQVHSLQISIKDITPIEGSKTAFHFNFEFCCTSCGGYLLHLPDDATDESDVSCTACGQLFGKLNAIKALGYWIGQQELRRRKLGAFAD